METGIVCWIKAFFYALAVGGTWIGMFALFFGTFGGLIWLMQKSYETTFGKNPTASAVAKKTGKGFLWVLGALALVAVLFASKREVCLVGFKQAYINAAPWTPEKPAPSMPMNHK